MFPAIEPFATGMLEVGDGNTIYWETAGNPQGKPALHLHGGPGAGMGHGYRRRFDPQRCLIVGFEQRGCGRSRPLATDDLSTLSANTTQAQVADIELLRRHLQIERWLVAGVSWGTALALAYALGHPDRVTAMVLTAIAPTTRPYVDWITDTVGALFPWEWERFEQASMRAPGQRVVDGYSTLLMSADPQVRATAAAAWCAWEGVHISLDPQADAAPPFHDDPLRQQVFTTLVVHYFKHDGFLSHSSLLAGVSELSGMSAVLLHGRYDVSGPLGFAWQLHRAWPSSELVVIHDEGHGGPRMMEEMAAAISRLL